MLRQSYPMLFLLWEIIESQMTTLYKPNEFQSPSPLLYIPLQKITAFIMNVASLGFSSDFVFREDLSAIVHDVMQCTSYSPALELSSAVL